MAAARLEYLGLAFLGQCPYSVTVCMRGDNT